MIEFFMGLLAFLAILLFLSFAGHLLWRGFVNAFTLVFFRRECPKCRRPQWGGSVCSFCEALSKQAVVPTVDDDLHAAERLLQLARFRHWLDDEQSVWLEKCLINLRVRVAGQSPLTTARPPQPAAAESTEVAPHITNDVDAAISEPPLVTAGFVSPPVAMTPPQLSSPISSAPASLPTVHALDMDYSSLDSRATAKSHVATADASLNTHLPTVSAPAQFTADVLRSFMERSNIRWVELISATLVVVCSVGLVISLWSTLSRTSRFFPSMVFMLATLAVHAAGQYTLRQWKLRTTSRGILHIGLMLIPLSVLVGILLSHRPTDTTSSASPSAGGIVMLLSGIAIYGGLAITATRALFSAGATSSPWWRMGTSAVGTSRHWPIALCIMICSASLVPIDWAAHRALSGSSNVVTLLPMLLVSMLVALHQSWHAMHRAHWTSSFARRHMGIVVQALFASLVVCVFWYLRFKPNLIESAEQASGDLLPTLQSWWWTCMGLLAVAWSGWGWSCSLARGHLVRDRLTSGNPQASSQPMAFGGDASWMIVAAWLIATVATFGLIASGWQASLTRISWVTLLAGGAVWWLLHGTLCRLSMTLLSGGLALVLALTLGAESWHLGWTELLTGIQWLSFERVTWLTVIGTGLALMSAVYVKLNQSATRVGLGTFIARHLSISGAFATLVAALLTTVASVVPQGPTPYGGQWSAYYLTMYGITITALGILWERQPIGSPDSRLVHWLLRGLLPVGAAISILANVRLFQSNPLLPEWIETLRPARAWSVGLLCLATMWSGLAAGLRHFGWRSVGHTAWSSAAPRLLAIDWLGGLSALLATISLIGIVRHSEDFQLAAYLHWQLPLIAGAIWFAWRSSIAREFVVLTTSWWSAITFYHLTVTRDCWANGACVTSFAAHVAVIASVVLISVILMRRWLVDDSQAASNKRSPWSFSYWLTCANDSQHGTFWSVPTLLIGCHVILGLVVLLPALVNLGSNLGMTTQELEISDFWRPFAQQLSGNRQATGVLATIILLVCTTALSGSLPRLAWLRGTIGFAPLGVALVLASAVATPNALIVCCVVLALSLIGSEALGWAGSQLREQSERSWQQLVSLQRRSASDYEALTIGRAISLGGLLALTVTTVLTGWIGQLQNNLAPLAVDADWLATSMRGRMLVIMQWMGPLIGVLALRWSLSVSRSAEPSLIKFFGGLLAVTVGCLASLVAHRELHQSVGLVAWLQWCSIAAGCLAAIVLIVEGRRWRSTTTEHGDAQRDLDTMGVGFFTNLGLGTLFVLSVMASIAIVFDALSSWPSLPAIATWPTALAFGLIGCVALARRFHELHSQSNATARLVALYAAQLAVLLGLFAPLGATFYAQWLDAVPGRRSVEAWGFEPYRAQLLLWLGALAIGLAVRIGSVTRRFSWRGEVLWLMLAVVVGALSLVGLFNDPQRIWPTVEIGCMAFLAVLSGCVAGQAWRGHIAAILAGIACCGWCLPEGNLHVLLVVWLTLFGPLAIAAVALTWRLATQTGLLGRQATEGPQNWLATVDQSVSLHVPITMCLISCFWVLTGPITRVQAAWLPLALVGVFAALLSVARLWDTRQGKRGMAVYLATIAAAFTGAILLGEVNELPVDNRALLWLAGGLSALAVVAGCLREWLRESPHLIPALRLGAIAGGRADFEGARSWLVPWHSVIGCALILPCLFLAVELEERGLRLSVAALPLLSALSILPIATELRHVMPRRIGLGLLSVATVLMFWGELQPLHSNLTAAELWPYGHRTFVTLVGLALVQFALSHRLKNKLDWERLLYVGSWCCLTVGTLIGGAMLAGNMNLPLTTTAALAEKFVLLVAWVAVVARLVQLALRPMGLDSRASIALRQAAVYAAEAGLAMLAWATYQCFPDLFGGVVADWWPLIVFGIAMLSAGLGHWSATTRHAIIADPVRRSSLLLPLIPLLGVWMPFSRELNIRWDESQAFALLLMIAAGTYALHGWLKPSLKIKGLAGLLALLSYWSLLSSRAELRFFEHPQFWILPPAVLTLVFVEWNRKRLDPSVVVATRYVAIVLAYLSSTADIVLRAFDGQLWQPILLLMLALAGVLAGMALRVRAFLYCGSAFVLVALLGMVWHAQQAIDQVWPWWAFGILTGVALITLLGYFEKNRPRVLAYLERLKSWEL